MSHFVKSNPTAMLLPSLLTVLVACSIRLTVSMLYLDEDEDEDRLTQLPVPKKEEHLDLQTFLKEISSPSSDKKIWSSFYTLSVEGESPSNIQAWTNASDNGDQLVCKLATRNLATRNCSELDGTGKLVKTNTNKPFAIYNTIIFVVIAARIVGKETGQIRFISKWPSDYFWAWYCSGPKVSNRKCQGNGTLTLMVHLENSTNVHGRMEAALDDLKSLGFEFLDSRLRISTDIAFNSTLSCK